ADIPGFGRAARDCGSVVLRRPGARPRDRRQRGPGEEDRGADRPCQPDRERTSPTPPLASHRSPGEVPPGRPAIALRVVEPPAAAARLDVKTPVFEGPLELLLALVEKEELDIFQV